MAMPFPFASVKSMCEAANRLHLSSIPKTLPFIDLFVFPTPHIFTPTVRFIHGALAIIAMACFFSILHLNTKNCHLTTLGTLDFIIMVYNTSWLFLVCVFVLPLLLVFSPQQHHHVHAIGIAPPRLELPIAAINNNNNLQHHTLLQNDHAGVHHPIATLSTPPKSSNNNNAVFVKEPVDVQAILNAVGARHSCLGRCTTSLVPHFKGILGLRNIYEQILPLCTSYNTTTNCIAKNHCQHSEIFDLVSSGIQSICYQKKAQFMHKHVVCIKAHLDQNSQECESQCEFIQSVGNFSRKPNLRGRQGIQQLLGMLGDLGGVCTSAQCYFPCFRDRMNADCEKAGGVITDALLRPFYRLAKIVEGTSAGIQKMIAEKVPKSCKFLLQKSSLDSIRQKVDDGEGVNQ